VFEDPGHILTDFFIGMEDTGVRNCNPDVPKLVWVPDSNEGASILLPASDAVKKLALSTLEEMHTPEAVTVAMMLLIGELVWAVTNGLDLSFMAWVYVWVTSPSGFSEPSGFNWLQLSMAS
jgi:hypothetical protein